jgi:uncharacterized lipoprotein YmbA
LISLQRLALWLMLGVLSPGCALTSKGEAMAPRYFNPEPPARARTEAAPQGLELRLGQVSSASHLDERLSYRVSAAEVGFYNDLRWTEPPEAYLRRALERELFEQLKLTRVVTGSAPVLDVELTAFEELRESPTRVRVTLTFGLRDDRRALLERSLELEAPLAEKSGGDPAQRVAEALANTLQRAVQQVGSDVVQRLTEVSKLAAERQSTP